MTVAADPLRRALLDQTRAEADERLAAADRRVEEILLDAEERGAALVDRARAEGEASATLAGSYDEARARRRAMSLVLSAKRELYDELREQALAGAHALRDAPSYPALLEHLAALAREQLGDDVEVDVDYPGGGLRASSGARHVDYSIDALVERCLDRLGERLEHLWT